MIALFTLSESVHALKIAHLVTNHMYRNHVFSQHNTLVVVMVLFSTYGFQMPLDGLQWLRWMVAHSVLLLLLGIVTQAICMFWKISVHLQTACTIQLIVCKCERSASVLLQLNNYMPASIGKSRLSHLALLQIHYDTFVDMFMVVDCYAASSSLIINQLK